MNKTELVVATCANSFKFSAHNNDQYQHFEQFIGILIGYVQQRDIELKKNCLISLNSIAFNKNLKICLNDKIDSLISVTLGETQIRKEYITTVDLGPFKHTVDKGEPIRKAAFSLLETISENFRFN